MPAWFETLFDDRYLKFYPELFDLDVAEREAAFVDRALSLPSGASLLDLGCGFGRHSVPLARLGYRVSGVDLSTPMLNAARRLASEREVTVEWVQRDMRNLLGLGLFDACVCLYTVFGYFEDETNESVLRSIRELLNPRAPLLIDVSNPLAIVHKLPREIWQDGPFGTRLERSTYDALQGRVMADRVFIGIDGTRDELPRSSVRLYTPSELKRLLEQTGFEVEAAYGALADEPFAPLNSPKLVMLARRA